MTRCFLIPGQPPLHSSNTNQYTESTPTSTQHKYHDRMFLKYSERPSVHSINTNQNTALALNSTQQKHHDWLFLKSPEPFHNRNLVYLWKRLCVYTYSWIGLLIIILSFLSASNHQNHEIPMFFIF